MGPDPTRGRAGLPLLQVGVAAGLSYLPQLSGGVPRGYLRVLVFNADSALVSQQVQQLSSAALNNYKRLRLRVLVPQDGYVSAFVGNESDADVLFDDITVELRQGVQVQETQYDPTGLEMAGLTGTTPGLKSLSQYKFNGKEFQTDLGLNWNHQDWRFLDPQLGRWHVVDPELENGQEAWTPYSFGFDNAVRYADADGRFPIVTMLIGAAAGAVTDYGIQVAANLIVGKDLKTSLTDVDGVQIAGAAVLGGLSSGLSVLSRAGTISKTLYAADKVSKGEKIMASAATAAGRLKVQVDKTSTLKPGPFAKASIPARSPAKKFTPAERTQINELGKENGCHTCGSTDPKTKSGDFVPDHQPSSALNPDNKPQVLLPHCVDCSRQQGGQVNGAKTRKTQ